MAVFTALRNKAQSGLAGLVTGAASSALGLNRASGLRFPDSGGNRPSGDTGRLYQYPLDLGSTGNSHFISFFVRERQAAKVTQTAKNLPPQLQNSKSALLNPASMPQAMRLNNWHNKLRVTLNVLKEKNTMVSL